MNFPNFFCTTLSKKLFLLHFNRQKLMNYICQFAMVNPVELQCESSIGAGPLAAISEVVSLCISLSRGKWFGSDSNDQINYPATMMMSHPRSLTDRETDLTTNESLSSFVIEYESQSFIDDYEVCIKNAFSSYSYDRCFFVLRMYRARNRNCPLLLQ